MSIGVVRHRNRLAYSGSHDSSTISGFSAARYILTVFLLILEISRIFAFARMDVPYSLARWITFHLALCTRLASCTVDARASRSSLTSLSWKVPAIRSTRPLPWGERGNTICIPSSSIARANWVADLTFCLTPGVCLKALCLSEYRDRGIPQRRISSSSIWK